MSGWKWFAVIAFAIITLLGSFYVYRNWGKELPGFIQDIIDREIAKVSEQYEAKLAEKEAYIQNYQNKINISQEEIRKLRTKVSELEIQLANIKAPETPTELRDRFRELGYPPTR